MKNILFLTILICLNFNLFSQSDKKNTISIFFSPTISKTNFTNLNTFDSGWLDRFYESQLPNKSILGYNFGIRYSRMLIKDFSLTLGIGYSLDGQKSPDFFKIKGISEADLNATPDYGGSAYIIKHKSYDFPLILNYRIRTKSKFSYVVSGGGLLNIYYRAEAKNFFISKESGKKESGANESKYFLAAGNNTFQKLRRHFNEGLYRWGGIFKVGIVYNVIPYFSIEFSPEVKFYGNLKDTSIAHTVVEGGFYNIGGAINLNYNF